MTSIVPGVVLNPTAPDGPLTEPVLVLHVTTRSVVAIPITARHKSKRYYFVGYETHAREKLQTCVDSGTPSIAVIAFKPRLMTTLTDAELNERFRRRKTKTTDCGEVAKRNSRYALIAPLVEDPDSVLLFDSECLSGRIAVRARDLLALDTDPDTLDDRTAKRVETDSTDDRVERITDQIRSYLNQFWAGGSVPGALTGFASNCGGRGKRRKAGGKKRGKPSARTKQGAIGKEGINITYDSQHAKTIKYCYDTYVKRHVTVAAALRRMWDEFYSVAVQQPDGSVKKEWLPDWERPTRQQFDYWGTIESPADSAFNRQLAPSEFDKTYRALMGSASDDVHAIGQRGAMDSSPPDTQYVRAIDRRERVGGGHRILIVDTLFGYIPGLYQGFDPPSARTVRLALFNAMDPDKRGWLDDLGLEEIPAEDFIPMYFSNLWGDNTDLRSEEVMKCARSVGTNVHYVPKLRSDLNPMAESGHKSLHRLVDHSMLGSTYGESRTTRGEESAAFRARHTMMEGIRESVRAMWIHNTAELDIERPLRMRLSHVPPTRIAMTKELIRLGKVARCAHAVEFARRQLLPRCTGTFTAHGVRLHRTDTGDKVCFIGRLRWVSDHPVIVRWCEAARRGGKHDPDFFRASFIVNGSRPRFIWFADRDTGECIELTARSVGPRDPDILAEMTVADLEDATIIEGGERQDTLELRNRKLVVMERAQSQARSHAEAEYESHVTASGGEPTKAEMKRHRREHAEAERASAIHGVPLENLAEAVSGIAAQSHAAKTIPGAEPVPTTSSQVQNAARGQDSPTRAARTMNSLLKSAIANANALFNGDDNAKL